MRNYRRIFELFEIFFKVGCFTFGGGLVMLPAIQKEVVDRRKLVSEDDIIDIFAISQSTPGVIAVNTAVFIGHRVAGIPGSLAALLGVVLPSFLSIMLVITVLSSIQGNPYVERVLAGIRAGSAAHVLLAAVSFGRKAVSRPLNIIFAALAFTAIIFFDISAIAVILSAAVLYPTFSYLLEKRRAKKEGGEK